MPLYVLGFMGMTRRLSHFDDPSLQIWFQIAAFGAVLIAAGIGSFLIQLVVSYFKRDQLRDVDRRPVGRPHAGVGDLVAAAVLQLRVHAGGPRPRRVARHEGPRPPASGGRLQGPIHMPKNTGAGVILAGLSTLFGFALIWHMWLVAGVAFAVTVIAAIVHTFNYKRDYYIPADEVARTEDARTKVLAAQA